MSKMPEEINATNRLEEMGNDLRDIIDKREKATILRDHLTEKERIKKYSDTNWKKCVLDNYKELQGEFDKLPIKRLHTMEGFEIEIINPIEHELFRVYAILTPLVLDVIIEFKIELDTHQKMLAKRSWTRVSALTNEKSRWVSAGTSLVDRYTKKGLIEMGTHWSENAFAEVFRIATYKIHKEAKNEK